MARRFLCWALHPACAQQSYRGLKMQFAPHQARTRRFQPDLHGSMWKNFDEVEHGHPRFGLRFEPAAIEKLALERGEKLSAMALSYASPAEPSRAEHPPRGSACPIRCKYI